MLNFEEYVNLIKKQAEEKLTGDKQKFFEVLKKVKEAGKEADKNIITASLGTGIVIPVKYKNEKFAKVIAEFSDDYNLAMEDMEDPEKFAAILSILNDKLAKDGDVYDMSTPETKMLGLANRYANNARECQYARQWKLFAFYMRSLAYFIPQLIEKANMTEEKVMDKIEAKLDLIKIESAYGDKRDYPKIDIFENGKYVATTTWAKTCKEAEEKYKEKHPDAKNVKARRSEKSSAEETCPVCKQDPCICDDYADDVSPNGLTAGVEITSANGRIVDRDGAGHDSIELKPGQWCWYFSKNDTKYSVHNAHGKLKAFKNGMNETMVLPDMKKRIKTVAAAREVPYQELVNDLDEKVRMVKNSLDKINSRFKYRMITNVSYPLKEANQIEEDIWQELNKIDKQVNKLWNKIG